MYRKVTMNFLKKMEHERWQRCEKYKYDYVGIFLGNEQIYFQIKFTSHFGFERGKPLFLNSFVLGFAPKTKKPFLQTKESNQPLSLATLKKALEVSTPRRVSLSRPT